MVVVNGTVTARTRTGGGLDADGYPVRPAGTWGQPIPCHIRANGLNNLGRQNGNAFKIASYEVLIEEQPFDTERVRLAENGRDLGEFSVMWTEHLISVGLLRIVV